MDKKTESQKKEYNKSSNSRSIIANYIDSKNKKLLILFTLLAVVLVIGVVWWNGKKQAMDNSTQYSFDKMARDGTLTGKSASEIQGLVDSVIEEGMFNVSMNSKAVFKDGKSEGAIGLENIPQNRYYGRVVIRRDDTNEVLYESKGLKPGQYIDKVKLKGSLPPGDYDCTAQVIATDPETLKDMGQVQVKIQIQILN